MQLAASAEKACKALITKALPQGLLQRGVRASEQVQASEVSF
jgi:hypothetical protein